MNLPRGPHPLTERDREVLAGLARGLDNEAIAVELRLSPRTVRNYVSRIYEKLAVENRVQAALWAQSHPVETPTAHSHSARQRLEEQS